MLLLVLLEFFLPLTSIDVLFLFFLILVSIDPPLLFVFTQPRVSICLTHLIVFFLLPTLFSLILKFIYVPPQLFFSLLPIISISPFVQLLISIFLALEV